MTRSSAIQLQEDYLRAETDEEIVWSDDSEASVVDMNRWDNVATAIEDINDDDDKSCVTNFEETNEITNDNDYEDEYEYSEESICTNVSCINSDMTNVTPRSSTSLDYSGAGDFREIPRDEKNSNLEKYEENHQQILRVCSSATDNAYLIDNEDDIQRSVNVRSRRRNMSFTNLEMRKIERDNEFLLKKIMAQKKPQNKLIRAQSAQPRISSSAINRRKLQKKIEEENMILLRKIQGAKSCANTTNTTPGYRVTSL